MQVVNICSSALLWLHYVKATCRFRAPLESWKLKSIGRSHVLLDAFLFAILTATKRNFWISIIGSKFGTYAWRLVTDITEHLLDALVSLFSCFISSSNGPLYTVLLLATKSTHFPPVALDFLQLIVETFICSVFFASLLPFTISGW